MLGFLYYWFIGKWGQKISYTKTQTLLNLILPISSVHDLQKNQMLCFRLPQCSSADKHQLTGLPLTLATRSLTSRPLTGRRMHGLSRSWEPPESWNRARTRWDSCSFRSFFRMIFDMFTVRTWKLRTVTFPMPRIQTAEITPHYRVGLVVSRHMGLVDFVY